MLTEIMISSAEDQVAMLQRHLELLQHVITNEPIGIVKLSKESGYPKHKIRYSLRVLEDTDLIVPTNNGATTTDKTAEFVAEINRKIEALEERFTAMKLDLEKGSTTF